MGLQRVYKSLRELPGIIRAICPFTVNTEIEKRSQPLGVSNPIRELTLDRDGLEVSRRFLEYKRYIGTGDRHGHDGRCRAVIEEGKTSSFPFDLAVFVLQNVSVRLNLHEAEHIQLLS